MKSELINYARGLGATEALQQWIEKRVSDKQAKDISKCEHVRDSKITDLGKLTTIGGPAYFGGSKITEEQIKMFQSKNKS